ncbi:hypothetical protein H2198_007953 [Neophaeococcomyces mojaviensis]|uniref:Uncharacterized protein n=1 Tax=Neophaeococcomyces mojaviensis TaxID=3383035 RepID=A0ACC2ZZA7_9EURO|nr:hypothetical protein H2198_007953 [Knufia sp. JES_112]
MGWTQFHSSQPHPQYPLLARTVGQNPQHEGRACCLCDQLISEDTRTLTHSWKKCNITFHENCFALYDDLQRLEHGQSHKSPCPSCQGKLEIESTVVKSHMPEDLFPRKAAQYANIALGAYVELMRQLWYESNPNGNEHEHRNDHGWDLETTSRILSNGLRNLVSQIQVSENNCVAHGLPGVRSRIPSMWFGDEEDVEKLEKELEAEEDRFAKTPLAQERTAALETGIPEGLEWQSDYLVNLFVDFFTEFDFQIELQRQQGNPMSDDLDGDEYHTSIEWAGEIHGFCAAVNFGFCFEESMMNAEEHLLESRIRERLARHLVTAHVFGQEGATEWTAKEDALDIDRRVCAFMAKMEDEYDNSMQYAED